MRLIKTMKLAAKHQMMMKRTSGSIVYCQIICFCDQVFSDKIFYFYIKIENSCDLRIFLIILVSIFVLYKDFIENTVTAENFLCEEIPRNTNVQKLLLSNSSQSYIAFIVNEKNVSGMTDSRIIFGWVNISQHS